MSKIRKVFANLPYAVLASITTFGVARAATDFSSSSVPTLSPSDGSLLDLAAKFVDAILIIISVVAVVYLIYGGVQYVTAGGDADKASKGRVTITNAIIGIVIILASFALYRAARDMGTGTI